MSGRVKLSINSENRQTPYEIDAPVGYRKPARRDPVSWLDFAPALFSNA